MSIENDNALKLEAALLEGLDPDSFYEARVELRRSEYATGSWKAKYALLHWSAFYNASECTEVVCFSESTLDYRVKTLHLCPLNPRACNLKVLLEYGVSVDKLEKYGDTPLHVAADAGHAKVAEVNLRRDLRRLL